jgi:putative membrane protein
MNKTAVSANLALLAIAVVSPAWAVSMPTTRPAQPLPNDGVVAPSVLVSDNWSPGSASLVPLMAADAQANQIARVDAPADAAGGAVGKPIDDISFVRQATENGRKEVNSARDALGQLKKPELKQIAQMLVTDHSNANAQLSKLAEAKGWPVPGPQASAPPPSGTASGDFDAKWTAEMIAGHERSVALYRAQADGGEDKDLRKYARDTLPTIEHHLAELKSLQK